MKTGLPVDYTKCDATLGVKWEIAEGKGEGMCPGGQGDQADISGFLDACTDSVAAALAGTTPLPADVLACNTALTSCGGNLSTCNTNYTTCSGSLTTCNASYASCEGNLGTCNTNYTTCTGDLGTCNTNYTTCSGDLTTCDSDLTACEAQPFAQPTKSGQMLCYNAAGSVIACSGTGQDGELQNGVARNFTDNGDGTITDNVTGLMWEKFSDDGSIHDRNNQYSWQNAFSVKIASLNTGSFAGHNDWRLPNMTELSTLSKFNAATPAEYSEFTTPCSPGCPVTTCSCTYPSAFWSSTTATTPSSALALDASTGGIPALPKTNTQNARAVRTAVTTNVPQPPPLRTGQTTCYDAAGSVISCAGTGQDGELQKGATRGFTDNGNGTITDSSTGLTWEKLSDDASIHDKDDTYTWANAFATKVATLNSTTFAGYNDWRVPNRAELETLVNSATFNPATFSAFNTSCAPACTVLTCSCTNPSSGYWSSTTYADFPTYAWFVYFYDGYMVAYNKAGDFYVRAVRGGS